MTLIGPGSEAPGPSSAADSADALCDAQPRASACLRGVHLNRQHAGLHVLSDHVHVLARPAAMDYVMGHNAGALWDQMTDKND
jgi:hypothetical protein